MRFFITIALIISAITLGVFTLVQTDQADFASLFSEKETLEPGQNLFESNLLTTAKVVLENDQEIEFTYTYDPATSLWNTESPIKDRADGPFHITPLILMAHTAEVQDSISIKSVDRDEFGIGKGRIHATFYNTQGDQLADFSIGKSSAYKKRIEGEKEILVPTIYIRKLNESERNTIYLATDSTNNIHKLFENNFERFRDHRPFALNINTLEKVTLKRGSTEISLERHNPRAAWVITKPLELETDPKATNTFLASITKLTAVKLHTRASVTLPENSADTIQISTKSLDQEGETTLTIYPATQGTNTVYATISDRDAVFELPLISTPDTPAYISKIPTDVNQLRSRTMVKLNSKDLRSIIVRTPTTTPVIITRLPGKPAKMLDIDNTKIDIDNQVLLNLVQSLSIDPIKNFVSDAATDFKPYGLDNPFLIIDLQYFQGEPTRIQYGTPKDSDTIYANLKGSPIIWEINTASLTKISRFIWDWKPKTIWNLPVVDIISFTTHQKDKPSLTVNYDYLDDSFTATLDDKDISKLLNPNRAKYFLNQNHNLSATKRLGPNHKAASDALLDPIFTIDITVQNYNNEGLPSGKSTYTLNLARTNKTGTSPLYYAKASNDPDFFLLDLQAVRQLATNLLED